MARLCLAHQVDGCDECEDGWPDFDAPVEEPKPKTPPEVIWQMRGHRIVRKGKRVAWERTDGQDAMDEWRWVEANASVDNATMDVLEGLAHDLVKARDDRDAIVKMLRNMAFSAVDESPVASENARITLRFVADLIEKGQIEWPPTT